MSSDHRAWAVLVAALGVGAAIAIAGVPISGDAHDLRLPARSLPAPTVSDPPTSSTRAVEAELRMTVIGDSYTGGSAEGGAMGTKENWVARMQHSLKVDGHRAAVNVVGLSGSGYVATGLDGRNFATAVSDEVTSATELVLFLGSRNDMGTTSDELVAAAQQAYTEARSIAPDVDLLVIGAPWVNENIPSEVIAVNEALRVAAEQFGAQFIDPVNDGWFFGQNSLLIGLDGVHPTNEGHVYMAGIITPLVASYF